ncbi:MAG: MotA/TolQ/ExbB proton channel family protein [Candidatus Sumerlaeaceae bacterium]|nr:MotA/TolQ/ExbB proton channel family protein [Candidatus Sumerlaeaceae bacterium]
MKVCSDEPECRHEPWAVHGVGVLGVALGIALYAVTTAVLINAMRFWSSNDSVRFVHDILLKRGIIPHLEALGFWIGLSLLLLRLPILRHERRFLKILRGANGARFPAGDLRQYLDRLRVWGRPSVVGQVGLEVAARCDTAASGAELDGAIEQACGLLQRKLESTHVPVRYLMWLIPTLGFVGTVLGISLAVAGFGSVMGAGGTTADIQNNLVQICGQLAVAFDTTFLALCLTAFLALGMAVVDRQEIALVSQLEHTCLTTLKARLCGHRFLSPSVASQMPQQPTAAECYLHGSHAQSVCSGTTIVIQSHNGNGTNLEEIAQQVVARALTQLAQDGSTLSRSIAESGGLTQIVQAMQASLALADEHRAWLREHAVTRHELEVVSQSLQHVVTELRTLLTCNDTQMKLLHDTIRQLNTVLERLAVDGVRADLVVQSVVLPSRTKPTGNACVPTGQTQD